jgi:hypothetical protein
MGTIIALIEQGKPGSFLENQGLLLHTLSDAQKKEVWVMRATSSVALASSQSFIKKARPNGVPTRIFVKAFLEDSPSPEYFDEIVRIANEEPPKSRWPVFALAVIAPPQFHDAFLGSFMTSREGPTLVDFKDDPRIIVVVEPMNRRITLLEAKNGPT